MKYFVLPISSHSDILLCLSYKANGHSDATRTRGDYWGSKVL